MSASRRCFWCGFHYFELSCEHCLAHTLDDKAKARHDGGTWNAMRYNPSLPFKQRMTQADRTMIEGLVERLKKEAWWL